MNPAMLTKPATTLALLICALSTLLGCTSAVASISPATPLGQQKPFDPQSVFKDTSGSREVLVAPNAHQLALSDYDNRIDESMKVPGPLKETVSFWLRIYTEYTTEQTVLFDKKHPEVVYEVMDFKDLHKISRNAVAFELNRERKLNNRIKVYRAAFASLTKKAKKKKLSPEAPGLSDVERKILATLSRSEHAHTIKEWNSGFRAQTGQRDQVIKGLLNAEAFFPKMEEIFENLDVPKELTRIPLVESSFNIRAHSKAGAQGVWQFMPLSGKEYMKVDPVLGIDERLSPLKSTVAAARLLRRNLVIAGNWPLAITAYNHGYTGIRVLSPAERATALDGRLFSLCTTKKKRRTLGYASSNYYAEFIALLHAEVYKDLFYGDQPLPVAPALTFHRVTVPMTAKEYSKRNGISLQDFKLFNPDVKNVNAKLPYGFYVIRPGEDGEIDDLISAIKSKPVRTQRFAKKTSRRSSNRNAMVRRR